MSAAAETDYAAAELPPASSVALLASAVKQALLTATELRWPAWDYRLAEDSVALFAKSGRDYDERETMLSCGISLQNLKLTLRRFSRFGAVDLFPDLDRPNFFARVHLGNAGPRDGLEENLLSALARPKRPVAPPPDLLPPAEAIQSLELAANDGRGWLEFARSETSRTRLQQLTESAPRWEVDSIHLRNRVSVRQLPAEADAPLATTAGLRERFSRWRKVEMQIRVHPSPSARHLGASTSGSVAVRGSHATYAVLKTKTDDKHGWLAAGQALARVILQSRAAGLPYTLFHQSLNHAGLREQLRTDIGRKGFVQSIVRFEIQSPRPVLSSATYTSTTRSFPNPPLPR